MGLWVFVALIPFERNITVPGLGALGTPFGLVAAGLALLAALDNGRVRLRVPSLFLLLMGLFVLWSGLSFFWSITPGASLSRTVTFGQLLIMAWLIWQLCRTEHEQRALLQSYVVGGYVAVGVVLFGFFTGEWESAGASAARHSFVGGNPNWLALGLAVGIPMAWHLVHSSKHWSTQSLNGLYIALAILAIGLTGSRGGFVTATVAMSVIPLTYWHLGVSRKVTLLAVLAGALYSAFILIPEANLERLLTASDEIAGGGTLTGRTLIWQAGVEVLGRNQAFALVGSGSGTFDNAVEPLMGRPRPAHNAYLSVLVGSGVVGFALFTAVLFTAIGPVLTLKAPFKQIYLVLWLTLCTALVPANIETQKHVWFTLTMLTTAHAFVVRDKGKSTAIDMTGRVVHGYR